jgi:hypothetical protein
MDLSKSNMCKEWGSRRNPPTEYFVHAQFQLGMLRHSGYQEEISQDGSGSIGMIRVLCMGAKWTQYWSECFGRLSYPLQINNNTITKSCREALDRSCKQFVHKD